MHALSVRTAAVFRYVVPIAFVLSLLTNFVATGQEEKNTEDHGVFLVARRELSAPLFEKSVVLMLPIPKKETGLLVGVIVNKPTRISLQDLFEDSPALKKRGAMVYFGGPVGIGSGAISAIFRSAMPPKNATLVFNDVYVTFDRDTVAALAGNVEQVPALRIFLGRAQWAPIQLENEMTNGSWDSMRADRDSIFSSFPEADWRRLIERAEPRPSVENQPIFSRPGELGS